MSYVLNTSDVPIPNNLKLTPEQKNELFELQSRKHLRAPRQIRDKDGLPVEVQKPLSGKERANLERWEQIERDQNMPSVGHLKYPFAPLGQDGCAWELTIGAQTICDQHPGRLKIVSRDELMKLRQLPRFIDGPTKHEWGYGFKEGEHVPPTETEIMTHSAVVKDGMVTDPGTLGMGAKR